MLDNIFYDSDIVKKTKSKKKFPGKLAGNSFQMQDCRGLPPQILRVPNLDANPDTLSQFDTSRR
jgi:hypothetical protein